MKLIEIATSIEALNKILSQPVEAKIAWKIARFVKEMDIELEPFQIGRRKIFEKHGKEEDGMFKIPPKSEGLKELAEYDKAEINIKVEKIKLEDLGDIKLSATDCLQLEWILE